ncbi:RNA-directed DNA polymerase, eukaryota [Tanacetum coccineum]
MAVFDVNQPASSLSEEDDVAVSNSHVVSVSSSINTGCDSFASHDDNASCDCYHHEFIDTPGGSVYWVPRFSASVLPVLGTIYDSLDECIDMYRKYASEAGFGVRLSCQKRLKCFYVKQKYIVCNREGCPKDVWLNTLDPKKNDRQVRSSNFRVCGCKARILFDMVPHTTKYTLTTFDVEHNHELDRVEYKHLSKAKRKLTYNEQLFIIKAANANISAVRAHNLYTGCPYSCMVLKLSSRTSHVALTASLEITMLKCSLLGWKRGKSSQKTFLLTISLRMLSFVVYFGLMKLRSETTRSLVISYLLMRLIKQTNNHRRSETVGSGLLKKETKKAYGWLLRAFKKAFVHAPNIVVTDQDGAMRLAVAAEFPESKHRLCMWHIMQKMPSKIVSRIYDDTDFKDKFGKIVWNMFIRPEEFEDRWNKFMEEFNLVNHKWLSKSIVSDHHGSPLSFSSSTLVKFMLCYESAMEMQRYTQEKLDHHSFDSFPTLLTPLPIEEHDAKVYTHNLFIRVQKEIVAGSWLCSITGMSLDEGCIICIIDEEKIKPVGLPGVIDKESTSENVEEEINLHQKVTRHYKVLYNKGDCSVSYCCQLFVRFGIYVDTYFVYSNFKVSCIPDQYILRRWTKDLIPPDLRNKKNRYGEKNEAIEKLAMEASIILDSCVHMLRNNEPKLFVFVNKIQAIKSELKAELPIVPTRTVSDFDQEFMGVKKPDKVKVKNPTGVRPKGREKQKHIKSGRQISMKKIIAPDCSDHVDGGLRDGASGSVSV